jgi:hypothetical protein
MAECYRYKGVHIPGCWGCAVYGHWRCTCQGTDERGKLLLRIEALERRVAGLPPSDGGES